MRRVNCTRGRSAACEGDDTAKRTNTVTDKTRAENCFMGGRLVGVTTSTLELAGTLGRTRVLGQSWRDGGLAATPNSPVGNESLGVRDSGGRSYHCC